MRLRVRTTAATFAVLSFVLIEACYVEEKFIFFPSAEILETPRNYSLSFDDVYFKTEDGVTLNGWFVAYPGASTTVLWFHGNGGNIGHRAEHLKLLHDRLKVHIFIFDYRGYGKSEGKPSELGTYQDGAAALAHLRSRKEVESKKIVFFGQSLGAAVATEIAVKESCLALVLEAPFASIRDMARVVFPLLPIGSFLRTKYDTLEKIKNVRAPTLVLHGDRDDIVPFDQGKRVFAAAPEPKEFYTIRGSGHNDTYIAGGEAYFRSLNEFIEKALQLVKPQRSKN
jgi:fermentation-respiration switch protein FrsA (DUF1100 family)